MGGQGSSSSAKPFFHEGQKEAAGRAIQEIIVPQLFGGGPNFQVEQMRSRGERAVTQQVGSQGLSTEDGVAQARFAANDEAAMGAQQQQFLALLDRIFDPAGQKSQSSSFGFKIT